MAYVLSAVCALGVLDVRAAGAFNEDEQITSEAASPTGEPRSSDVVRPVYYPHSPHDRRHHAEHVDEVEQLFDRFLHLHSTMQYDDALEVAEQLLECLPESAVMHYNHACVLGRLLRTDEALDALERAIELGWRNASHLEIDPDLAGIRWHERYDALVERLAAKIRREQPAPGPLRNESWQTIVRDIEMVAPNLMVRNGVSRATISLVHEGKHVWSGTFARSAAEGDEDIEHPEGSVQQIDSEYSFLVEGPAQLLAMLGVLERWEGDGEPGVLRLVELCRHVVRSDRAWSGGSRPAGRRASRGGSDTDDAGAFTAEQHQSNVRNRRALDGRVWRISHVPDDVHDVFRMAVEQLSGDNFSRYVRERAFETVGMKDSTLVIVGERGTRGIQRIARSSAPQNQQRGIAEWGSGDWDGPPRPVLRTTADDLAALISHVLSLKRSPQEQGMDWHQVSDHLLRAFVTREVTIGSTISIQRTPFGLRTEVVSAGGGAGCMMRWYPQSGCGVVVVFEDDSEGSGERLARRLAHVALGGDG